jgi:glycosyltransferase involved in cell wall biosynthesis
MACKFVIADQNAVSAEGHFQTYTNALAIAAQGLGCDVTVLWNKRFPISSFSASYRMEAVFTCTEAEAAARNLAPYGEGHFGFELERALAPLRLGAQDHVVIHTCHFVELTEALDYLASLPPSRDLPNFHIVVRYDPDVYRYRLRPLMRRLGAISRTAQLREKLKLHSDTQQLATAFAALFGAQVGVCPIPVDLDRLLPAAAQASPPSPDRPLIATYLGTARSEKGYRDLLGAIAFLRERYIATDRLHFVLQCSDRSIGGEPGLADYQREFEACIAANGLADKIRLVKHVVEQEEYCALAARSDIVLLAYSPESYRARSSSVLIEAMSVGKVVVTRAGSWMASRVGADNAVIYDAPEGLGPALAEAVERFDDLNRGAKARQPEAIVSGDPATLARHFLASGKPSFDEGDARPAILMIGDGDAIAAGSLRASVFLHRLACCVAAGYRVDALLLSSRAADDVDVRRRIVDAIRPYPLGAVSILAHGGVAEAANRPAAIWLGEGVDAAIIERLGLAGLPLLAESDAAAGASDVSRRLFPFALQPAQIEDLAGPVDGFELVASSDPLRADLWIENRPLLLTQERYAKLQALDCVDILLHCFEAESARWFAENVYAPYLAQRGVTVLAIGAPDAPADVRGFLSVGPVANRDPLYAAAKLVVVGMGPTPDASYALFEALARAKPALLFADRQTDPQLTAYDVHHDARSLSDAIIGLLESGERRAHAAARSARLAETLGAGQSGAAILARLTALGVAAPDGALRAPPPDRTAQRLVEWNADIRAANRFVRACLANEPFENITALAAVSDALDLTARIVQALIETRDAPLLQVDGGLLARVQQRQAGAAAEIMGVARIALDATRPRQGARAASFIVNRRFATEIATGAGAGAEAFMPLASGLVFEPMAESPRGLRYRLRDNDSQGAELAPVEAHHDVGQITVRQEIPSSPQAWALGEPVFANWTFGPEGLSVRAETPTGRESAGGLSRLALRLQSLIAAWSPSATAHQLFDARWYVAAYPETSASGLAPFRHYERYGAAKGYRPNPFFDAQWYGRRYGTGAAAAWRHYLKFGDDARFDPGPHFSASRYLHENRDVARSWRWSPLLHYTLLGRGEGRDVYAATPLQHHQSLALPVVIGDGEAWVEFILSGLLADSAPFALHVDDRRLELALRVEDGRTIARAHLPRDAAVTGLVHAHVALSPGAGPLEVLGLRTGWTSAG